MNTVRIAVALAMAGGTYLNPDENFTLSANLGAWDDSTAMAFTGAARLNDTWSINTGVGVGSDSGEMGGRVGVRVGW